MFFPNVRFSRPHPRAFTLIELLTVIAIIGILAAIIIPVVGRVRESARRSQSTSNLRQIAMATMGYVTDNKNTFPKASQSGWSGNTWQQEVMPYLGQNSSGSVRPTAEIFRAPNDRLERDASVAQGAASYGMNYRAGPSGPFQLTWPQAYDVNAGKGRRLFSEVANPSQTIMVAEIEPWATAVYFYTVVSSGPGNLGTFNGKDGSGISVGNPYAFCDASVRWLTPAQTLGTGSLTTPKGLWTIQAGD